jgi:translation initiation factor IF-2
MKQVRPPIVTVLGHVDHGKTTLLDAIRKTKVAPREAGGITQGIGASLINFKNQEITFIDTPGHAAFAKMRERGAKLADIAILVVAADDGIMPQTSEALQYIQKAQIPFLVAITKIDLPAANPELVIDQVEKEGVAFEGRGGNVPKVLVSAPKNQGLSELLEVILLMAEVQEIQADPEGSLEALTIEVGKDNRGVLVAAVVREGTLKKGVEVQAEGMVARVRSLFDQNNQQMAEALPGEPCLILGFPQPPAVGSVITAKGEMPEAVKSQKSKIEKPQENQVPVVLKAQNQGALEAMLGSVPEGIFVLSAGVGEVIEADVFTAKGGGAKYIFGFNAKVPKNILQLAEAEGIKVESFKVIYELTQKLQEIVTEKEERVLGEAQIVASFPFNSKRVAGCKMLKGQITKNASLTLMRQGKPIGKVKAVSLRRQKEEISVARAGEEFGVIFRPQLDFAEGDMLLSVA